MCTEIIEVIEDTVEYACDKHMLSGQLLWTLILALATSKLAELKGEVNSSEWPGSAGL